MRIASQKNGQKLKRPKISSPIIRNHQGIVFIAVDKKFYRFSLSDLSVSEVNSDFKVEQFEQNGMDQMMVSKVSIWNGSLTTEFSLDKGNSWHSYTHRVDRCPEYTATVGTKTTCPDAKSKYSNYKHVSQPVFFSDGVAYSIFAKQHYNFWSGKNSTTYIMVKSTDNGQSWQKLEDVELPKFCTNLLKGAADDLLLNCQNTTGQFYHSAKDDIDWQVDHEPTVF